MYPPLIRMLLNDIVIEDFDEPISHLGIDHEQIADLINDTVIYQYYAIADSVACIYDEGDVLRENDQLIKVEDLTEEEYEQYVDEFNAFDCSNPLYECNDYGDEYDDDVILALMDLSMACASLAHQIRAVVIDCKLDGTYDIDYQVDIRVVLDYDYGIHFAYIC